MLCVSSADLQNHSGVLRHHGDDPRSSLHAPKRLVTLTSIRGQSCLQPFGVKGHLHFNCTRKSKNLLDIKPNQGTPQGNKVLYESARSPQVPCKYSHMYPKNTRQRPCLYNVNTTYMHHKNTCNYPHWYPVSSM